MTKYSIKRIREEVDHLARQGYDLSVEENPDGTVKFTSANGHDFPDNRSMPLHVEQAKFFLLGYKARCGR